MENNHRSRREKASFTERAPEHPGEQLPAEMGSAASSSQFTPSRLLALAVLAFVLLVCLGPNGTTGNKLRLLLQKREASAPTKMEVSVGESKAKEFLNSMKRQKRQLWDRSQPDVQQWYQQFLYMGFDETKFEDDVTYWINRGRDGHDYYGGYYQRHYDEDAAIGPRHADTFRHGASVNYDDY